MELSTPGYKQSILVFMPPTWKVLRGYLVIGLCVCLSVCPSVCNSVPPVNPFAYTSLTSSSPRCGPWGQNVGLTNFDCCHHRRQCFTNLFSSSRKILLFFLLTMGFQFRLTAFVVRSFAQANAEVPELVDVAMITQALTWLFNQFNPTEKVFNEPGRVIHQDMLVS